MRASPFGRYLKLIACLLVCGSGPAFAVPINLDKPGVRSKLGLDEGYLSFHFVAQPFGEERTGWTDIRHPANDGTNFTNLTDTKLGYDRSDFSVQVHNKITTVDAAGGGKATADPNIPRDYNFANQIWAQAGISVLSTGKQSVDFSTGNAAGNTVVDAPVTFADLATIEAENRKAAPIVNNWYAPSGVDNTGGVLRGVTNLPGSAPATSGTMIFDNAANDTFAHELGHYLLDQHKFTNPGDTFHSPSDDDLMAAGSQPRLLPDETVKEPGDPTAEKGNGGAPRQPGQHVGSIGTVDHLNETVKLNGAGAALSQTKAVHESASVSHTDNGLTYGDRADFDWVEDNKSLEAAGGKADNHPGSDFMIWEIGTIASSAHINHDHDDWGELALGAFVGDEFRVVDVISQISRYADMDVDSTGQWSRRESALDYVLDFSADAVNWVAGEVVKVFVDGWTTKSDADDYVARWRSSIDAKYVRIAAAPLGGTHDGNAQIDAIIAGRVPEPSSLTLFGLGLCFYGVLLGARRKRHAFAA